MKVLEVTNLATNSAKSASQSSYKAGSGIASEYSKILAEKISNVKADIQAMTEVQSRLDEIADLQEELTGNVKVDEDSGNANRDEAPSISIQPTETVKRYRPDGSIMVTTYEGSRIVEQVKHKPHMIVVPDYTAPPKADGSTATKLEARQNFEMEMLLMM